jgi:type II secretory pathway pseudopilin PulG
MPSQELDPMPHALSSLSFERKCQRRIRSGSPRRGFTLLEVLLAAGLSLVLLVAVLSAVTTYRDVSMAGREQVEQAQLVRAILRRMELDIRSVAPVQQAADEETEESSATDSAEESTEVTVVDTVESIAAQGGGLFGDTATLVVHVIAPQRPGATISSGTGGFSALAESDLKTVAYFLAEPGIGGLPGISGDLLAGSGQRVPALARLEGQRLTLAYAEATADVDTLAGLVSVMASEVAVIQFRYFDGLAWYEVWDSSAMARLPNAVEITLALHDPERATSLLGQPEEEIRDSRVHRHVIALPIAEPATATSSTTLF